MLSQAIVEFAVSPGLRSRIPAQVFRDILADMLCHAIAKAPIPRLLIAGGRKVSGPIVTLTFEAPPPEREAHMVNLRRAQQMAARHTAELGVDFHAGAGVSLVLRLRD